MVGGGARPQNELPTATAVVAEGSGHGGGSLQSHMDWLARKGVRAAYQDQRPGTH